MIGSSLSRVRQEEHAIFILFIAVVIMIFWHSVWELLSDFTSYIEKKYGYVKWKIHAAFLVFILILILIFPQILSRI